VIYTDGVVEARGGLGGGQLFGEQRLIDLLADCRELPAAAIAERVTAQTARWLDDGTHDDIAVLVVQAPSVQEELPAARRHLYAVPLVSGKEGS
jgi:serine phosphatase RsbU (regulator of sigma subunit)